MHFFIDHTQLPSQIAADGYGPDSSDLTHKYNVTSRFQLSNPAKAFACQKGMMIVQQSAVDPSLVNVILKPNDSLKVAVKVSYFVYRGILKSSLINGSNIVAQDPSNNELIARIWVDPPQDSSYGTLGYDNNTFPGTDHIETIFNNSRTNVKPITVKEGEWFGDFSKDFKMGFEIVMESDRFNVNLDYVRAEKYQVDVTGLVTFNERAKREEILSFIDPVAFFGLHYTAGVRFSEYTPAKTTKTTKSTPQTDPDYIYTKLLNFFDTKNRVYLDIRSEKGYSYNFYQNYLETATNNNIKVGYGTVAPVGQDYSTNSWPIIYINAAQTTTAANNNIRFNLRVDDNINPLLYIEDVAKRPSDPTINYIPSEHQLILTSPLTDWSRELRLQFPNTGSGASRNNVAAYIKCYYFRQLYNAASPNSVLTNIKYYDSAFCSVDLRNIGDPAVVDGVVKSEQVSYVREPLQTDGTGNFGYAAETGAYWDTQRVVLYSTKINECKRISSEKLYLNAYTRKLTLENQKFRVSKLRTNTEMICREYTISSQPVRILGINSYRTSNVLNAKENAMMLGLTINEIAAVKSTTGLSDKHHRYIFLDPDNGNPLLDGGGNRYNVYTVQLQGLDASGLPATVTPQLSGNPILVYSRDNLFFSSSAFGAIEATVTPGQNRIEFHIYHDGVVKVSDNIDLSLVHDVQNIFFRYHDAAGVVHDICNLDVIQINKMGGGVHVTSIPAGYVSTIDYTSFGIDAKTSYIYADGTVITNGLKNSDPNYKLRYLSLGKKAFLVNLVATTVAALNISFTYTNTRRRYCSPEVTAAFFGAMAQAGYAMSSSGSCFQDGTPFPSVAHNNGFAIDTLYLNVLSHDQAFVNAMHAFGCTQILRGVDAYSSQLTVATNGGTLHNSHLHSGKVVLNNREINE